MITSDASAPVASRRVRALTLAAARLALFAIFLDSSIRAVIMYGQATASAQVRRPRT